MPDDHAITDLVGRDRLLGSLRDVIERVTSGERITALIAGQAGIGKTALLRAVASLSLSSSARVAWGTCLDVDGAPGYWPWTQALEGLVRSLDGDALAEAVGDDGPLLASIIPSVGEAPQRETSDRDRVLAMDATCRFLERLAEDAPLVVVLDDLQWADASSLALLELAAGSSRRVGLGLVGAYRDHDLSSSARQRLSSVVSRSEHFPVEGLGADAVHQLIERTTGEPVDRETAMAVHHRTGGHPFFVRELVLGGHTDATGERVPIAVRGAIERRVAKLPNATVQVLEATAVAGSALRLDVVAAALGRSTVDVEAAARAAIDAGILTTIGGESAFADDLLRETITDRVSVERRQELHQAIGSALEARVRRGAPVAAAELARHFIAAVSLDGPDRATVWALRAAVDDCASLAFCEAAAHLRRLRGALADAAVDIGNSSLVDVLLAEADALARDGSTVDARDLLHHAADVAARTADPEQTARIALATAQLGARFATRRDDIIRQLDDALTAVATVDDAMEARLTATLARGFQHSVAEDRPRAGPLSERALELGRRSGQPDTLLDCLLARHDVLWVPGAADQRADIAREIVAVAAAVGDEDRHAEGLLLLANALLEQGSPAFEAALESCLAVADAKRQPRHRYTALTRRACVALLRNRLDDAARLIDEARTAGERIREPDTDNVYMSQQLELVRARGDHVELTAFAVDAVNHWLGAPIHANAVAAGFLARAGDLDAASKHVAAVVDLGTWRADRSYLWSVFVRELAVAAIAVDNRELCDQLMADVQPLSESCGVNGAVVAFAGSHAHTASLLAAALDRPELADLLLARAAATYRRLGAAGWLAECTVVVRSPGSGAPVASMIRRGSVWHLGFGGREATFPHTKGLADIARLVTAGGAEIHVLELIDAADRSGRAEDIVDGRAIDAYRRRLADLDADVDEADRHNDVERRARAEVERQLVLDELGRVAGRRQRPRQFANHPAERARKAVTGRIRDTIRKLDSLMPELAAHLERTIVTGTYCRYRPDSTVWEVSAERDG